MNKSNNILDFPIISAALKRAQNQGVAWAKQLKQKDKQLKQVNKKTNTKIVIRKTLGHCSAICKRLTLKMAKANQVEESPLAWYPQETADSLERIKMKAQESRLRVLMKKKYICNCFGINLLE